MVIYIIMVLVVHIERILHQVHLFPPRDTMVGCMNHNITNILLLITSLKLQMVGLMLSDKPLLPREMSLFQL